MIRRPPRSTPKPSSAASDVYKRQLLSSFARRMKNGSAIFFSSVAGTKGLSNHEAIAAAKAGLEGMARSAAASYAKDNLRVNVIAPGLMDTNMSQRLLATEQARELSKSMYPICLLYTSPSPRDATLSRMPSSA